MATIAIVVAVSLMFGGIVLALVFAVQEKERQRELQASARDAEVRERVAAIQQAATVRAVQGFFAPPMAASSPGAIAFNDALASRLEHDIREEQAIVSQFVHHPSLSTLYHYPIAPTQLH